MREDEWIEAVRHRKRAIARWGFPPDQPDVRAEGEVIGYSAKPMVLIRTPDGEQVWWAAELTVVDDTPTVDGADPCE